MSVSTPLYPNLQSGVNQGEIGSTSSATDLRLSQSEDFGSEHNEFVFITDYRQVTYISLVRVLPDIHVV